jgi:hypothetical protein
LIFKQCQSTTQTGRNIVKLNASTTLVNHEFAYGGNGLACGVIMFIRMRFLQKMKQKFQTHYRILSMLMTCVITDEIQPGYRF